MTPTPGMHPDAYASLRAHVRGALIGPGEDGYDAARRVWNGCIDRRPAAILTCADAEDIAIALRLASERGFAVSVRGGGHNVAGRALRDGALLIDLSRLTGVWVNAGSQTVTVQGGATWSQVDEDTARCGLATTGGLVSSTGVGGFTLGGGAGWLMRKHGLACDNLLGANVVLGDGRVVRASAAEHPDLFWALRGGAVGLGVVSSFDFRCHPLTHVLAGLIVRSADQALTALQVFRDFAAAAPDEFCGLSVLTNAPPLPFLDAALHGRPVLIQAVCWCGAELEGARALAPLRGGGAAAEHIGWMPYVQWQKLQDAGAPAGLSYYWKTANYASLADDVLHTLVRALHQLPSPRSEIHVQHMGGAVSRVPRADTAFAHRDANFFINVIGVSDTPAAIDTLRQRVGGLYEQICPGSLPGAMPNFSDQDDESRASTAGIEATTRLQAIRRRYDPAGLLSAC